MSGKENAEEIELKRTTIHDDVIVFERLYDRYGSTLEWFLSHYDNHGMLPEDFIQEVFTRFWQQRKNFQNQSRFQAYLFGIARLTVKEEMRRSRKVPTSDLDENMGIDRDSHNDLSQPEEDLFVKELRGILDRVRASWTMKEFQALEISHDDVPPHEASQILGCSHEAYRSRLKRARKRSQELINPALIGE